MAEHVTKISMTYIRNAALHSISLKKFCIEYYLIWTLGKGVSKRLDCMPNYSKYCSSSGMLCSLKYIHNKYRYVYILMTFTYLLSHLKILIINYIAQHSSKHPLMSMFAHNQRQVIIYLNLNMKVRITKMEVSFSDFSLVKEIWRKEFQSFSQTYCKQSNLFEWSTSICS